MVVSSSIEQFGDVFVDEVADEENDALYDVCGIMFGDSGNCNFFISKEDLVKKDFSNVVYDWQCC